MRWAAYGLQFIAAVLVLVTAAAEAPQLVDAQVSVRAVQYVRQSGASPPETSALHFAVVDTVFNQAIYVHDSHKHTTVGLRHATAADMAGLLALQCGRDMFPSPAALVASNDANVGPWQTVHLGHTHLPLGRLIPITEFDDDDLLAALGAPRASNTLRAALLLDHAQGAAANATAPSPTQPPLLSFSTLQQCQLHVSRRESGGLANMRGELVLSTSAPLRAPHGSQDCEEVLVFDVDAHAVLPELAAQHCAPAPDPAAEMALLQVHEVAAMIPGLDLILDPVVSTAMKPILNTVVGFFGQDVMETLGEIMSHDMNAQIPGDVAAMLSQTLTANVSNMASDGVTWRLGNELVNSLRDELGAYLERTISEAARPRLHTALDKILSKSIPDTVDAVTPDLAQRSLRLSLVHSLTRSVTHALVPTLSEALAHTPQQDLYCYYCYYHHTHCRFCHYSAESTYYNNYYSTYYSDYYSDFYADYYASAVNSMDEMQHPTSHEKDKPPPSEPLKPPPHPWLKEKK